MVRQGRCHLRRDLQGGLFRQGYDLLQVPGGLRQGLSRARWRVRRHPLEDAGIRNDLRPRLHAGQRPQGVHRQGQRAVRPAGHGHDQPRRHPGVCLRVLREGAAEPRPRRARPQFRRLPCDPRPHRGYGLPAWPGGRAGRGVGAVGGAVGGRSQPLSVCRQGAGNAGPLRPCAQGHEPRLRDLDAWRQSPRHPSDVAIRHRARQHDARRQA